MLWGGELLLRDGEPAGQVTSAAWGATVGAAVGLAYLRADGPVTARLAGGARASRSTSPDGSRRARVAARAARLTSSPRGCASATSGCRSTAG